MTSRWMWVFSLLPLLLQYQVYAGDVWLNASPTFLQLHWPNTSLLHLSVSEPALVNGIKTFFTTEAVTVLNVRNATQMDNSSQATFEILFLIGDSTLAFNTTVLPAVLNTTGLAAALWKTLELTISDAAGVKNPSDLLWQVASGFQSSGVTCQSLTSAQVLTLYNSAPNFPAIRTIAAPTDPFLTFSVFFRNVNHPVKLTQSVVYQVRRGVAEFLGGIFNMSYVTANGPATVASDSSLQVNQTFYLRLPSTADSSMLGREIVANLLLFGDLTRLVAGGTAGSTRPAMFLDYIFTPTELSAALASQPLATSTLFAATLIPYVFRYMNVDIFPVGNPELPGTGADTATLLAAVSNDALNALLRKKQHFQYNPDGYTASLPQDVTYPSSVALKSLDLTGVFTTTIFWGNQLTNNFWLESAESMDAVSWNLFPTTLFFVDDSTSSSLPAAPIVYIGNTSTPLWTLQGITPERLDLALNFRSTDDNATLVKVEIAVRLDSSGDAESTVTSIARPSSVSNRNTSTSALNVVVRHQSRLLRNGTTDQVSKLLLYLEFGEADVSEKSADGCAHCQQLLDWCTSELGCAALKSCVFAAVQSPVTQLVSATATASETDDLYSLFNGCLKGSVEVTVDVNVLMLFTSAIRCQLQRLCGIQAFSTSMKIPSEIKLVWGSGKGQHRVQAPPETEAFPLPNSAPVNISVAIGSRIVCYLPFWNNATAASVKTVFSRSCTFAKYLGTVSATVNFNTTGVFSIDLFYDGLVGPMPTLAVVNSDTQTYGATITTIAVPSIRVRYVSAAGPVPYSATTDSLPTEACAECKRLALDVCLRDAKCAAMADCVMQYQTSTSVTVATDSSTSSTSLADAILKLVRGDEVDTKLSLEAGVNSCLPATITNGTSSVDVNGVSWRKLVNASACYSRTACPLALAPLLSSSWSSLVSSYSTVAKWSITPIQKLQRLFYTGSMTNLNDLRVPLFLTRDGVAVSASSEADSTVLTTALRELIQYEDIQVTQSTNESSTTVVWTISYGHWTGSLPFFIESGNKEWTLVSYPTISAGIAVPNESILELIPRDGASSSSTTVTNSTTSTT